MIICDVGHVEAVVLRGPRDLGGAEAARPGNGQHLSPFLTKRLKIFSPQQNRETILSQLISDEQKDGDIDRDSNVPDTCPQGTIYTVLCPDILLSPDTGWRQGEVILMNFTAPVSWTNQS